MLEPVDIADRMRSGAGGNHRFLGLRLNTAEAQWFRAFKEFFFPSTVSSEGYPGTFKLR